MKHQRWFPRTKASCTNSAGITGNAASSFGAKCNMMWFKRQTKLRKASGLVSLLWAIENPIVLHCSVKWNLSWSSELQNKDVWISLPATQTLALYYLLGLTTSNFSKPQTISHFITYRFQVRDANDALGKSSLRCQFLFWKHYEQSVLKDCRLKSDLINAFRVVHQGISHKSFVFSRYTREP